MNFLKKFLKGFGSRGFRKVLSRVIVCLLVFSMSINLFTVKAKAEANEIISTYVSIAAGKQLSDLDVSNLSEKDLQFLGIYISNFFVPFGTELGKGLSEDITKENKENIIKALQTSLNFSDSMAESLTDTILGLSMSNIKELELCVSKEYQKDLTAVSDSSSSIPLNLYTALCGILGGLPTIADWFGEDGNAVIQGIANETYKYGYFAYNSGGEYIPVFDFSLTMSELTPSASAFIKCLEAVNVSEGYGFSFFDFIEKDFDSEKLSYDTIYEKALENNDAYKMSAYGTKLSIDCFGNIILMGGNHQYIAVPGCMNPYTWATVDEDGKEVGSGLGGTAFNMINIPSLSLGLDDGSDKNSLLTQITNSDAGGTSTGIGDDDLDATYEVSFDNKNWKEFFNNNASYTENLTDWLGVVFEYACGGKYTYQDEDEDTGDFSILLGSEEGNLIIRGKASVLSSFKSSKIKSDSIAKDISDNQENSESEKYLLATEVQRAIATLGGSEYNLSESVIVSGIDAVQSFGKNKLKSDVDGEVGMIRKGLLDVDVFTSELKAMLVDGTKHQFSLRKVRGSSDNSFKTNGLFGIDWNSNTVRDLAKLFEEEYVSANVFTKAFYNAKADGIDIYSTKTIDVYGSPTMFTSGQLRSNVEIPILDSFVYVDNLGAAYFDDSSDSVNFSTFNVAHYLVSSEVGEDGVKKFRESVSNWGSSSNNGFTNMYEDLDNNTFSIPSVSDETLIGIYVTYAYAGLYDSSVESKQLTIGKLGYKLNSKTLPEIANKPLAISSEAEADYMLEAIRDWTYYLLHPTEGLDYFKIWITNKLNSFLLGWHDDMVGTNGTGSINGTTKYRGFSGYVTTPELTDIPWTDALLELYNNSIPFLLVVMILLMLASYIVGMLSLQKSIFGFFIFAVAIVLPPVLINGAVGTSNRFSSSLYGEKFTYWALIQHESYSTSIDKAAESGSYANYLRTLYEKNAKATGNQGSESIMLKWQAPKKMASLMLTENDRGVFDSLTSSSLISGLINATYSGESYLDNEDSVYLYRSYIDIANFSRYIHRGLSGTYAVKPVNMNLTNDITSSWDESLRNSIRNYGSKYEIDRTVGYANVNADGSTMGTGSNILRVRLPLSSSLVSDAIAKRGTVSDLGLNEYVGIDQRAFNFSIPLFNVKDTSYESVLEVDGYSMGSYTSEDYSGLAAYGLMSENPFYYFSWYLYETGLSEESGISTGYKNLLLGSDNAGFFYNTKGNGEMKDFMDMRSLFTYIIPYLKQGNDLVDEWHDVYGIFIYDGVPVEEGLENNLDISSDPELRQKYWHNINVMRLYNLYTPWVDIMYDCSYAKEEKISFLGEDYVIADPINPNSYPDERPMIFSRSEMLDYGLSEKDLTKVEKLILKCQDGMQERMFKLLNYHTFNDVVLNTAAAMNCAFEFNTTFSENSIVGEGHNIYPQAFELNDFSYDAFLRFILSNTTGDSMITNKGDSFYETVVNNSSMTTTIVLLVLDILAMYVIPGCKMFFIVGIFILVFLIILATAFRVDQEQKFITKLIRSFIIPVFKFMLVTCGMALVVSWFMGEGSTAITGSMETSISVGDPVMVMMLMIVLNCFVVYFYSKILLDVVKDIKSTGKMVGAYMGGVIGSFGGTVVSSVTSNTSYSNGGSHSGKVSAQGHTNPRANERGTVVIERVKEREETVNSFNDRSYGSSKDDRTYGNKSKSKSRKNYSSNIEEKTKKGMKNLSGKED